MSGDPPDPLYVAITRYVSRMCEIHVAVATGFHSASVTDTLVATEEAIFKAAWDKSMQDTGP